MWLKLAILLALGGILMAAANPWIGSGEKPVITIAADKWCPVNCTPNSKEEGVGIELSRAIFERNGYKVEYVTMPWTRAMDEVRRGNLMAVMGAVKVETRNFIFPAQPIALATDTLYMRKDKTSLYNSLASLEGLKLGIIKDYAYSDVIKRHISKYQGQSDFLEVATGEDALEQNIRQLQAGRIDVIVESDIIMGYMLQRMGNTGEIVRVDSLSPPKKVYIAFSPHYQNAQKHAEMFDEGMKALTKAHKLTPFYAHYGMEHALP